MSGKQSFGIIGGEYFIYQRVCLVSDEDKEGEIKSLTYDPTLSDFVFLVVFDDETIKCLISKEIKQAE